MGIYNKIRGGVNSNHRSGRMDYPYAGDGSSLGDLVKTNTTLPKRGNGGRDIVWNQDAQAQHGDGFTQFDSQGQQSMKVSATMHGGNIKAGAVKGESGWHGAVSNSKEGTFNTTAPAFKTRFGAARQARKGLEQMHTGTKSSQMYMGGKFAPQNDAPYKDPNDPFA